MLDALNASNLNITTTRELLGFFNNITGGLWFWDAVLIAFALVMILTSIQRGKGLKTSLMVGLFPTVIIGILLGVIGLVDWSVVFGSWVLVSVLSVAFSNKG